MLDMSLEYRALVNKPLCIKKWIKKRINLAPLGSEPTMMVNQTGFIIHRCL